MGNYWKSETISIHQYLFQMCPAMGCIPMMWTEKSGYPFTKPYVWEKNHTLIEHEHEHAYNKWFPKVCLNNAWEHSQELCGHKSQAPWLMGLMLSDRMSPIAYALFIKTSEIVNHYTVLTFRDRKSRWYFSKVICVFLREGLKKPLNLWSWS